VAWETRRGRKYYYVSVRRGSCVRKLYLGNGDSAQEAAKTIEAARAGRAEAAQRRAQECEPIDEMTSELDELGKLLDVLTSGRLLRCGWHKHHGQWRFPKRGRGNGS
jgi:hypothetical protein